MLGRALLLIVLIPLIELVLLNQLLNATSLPTTILVVLVTGVVGFTLTKRQGMNAWRAVHQQMAQGKSPSKEIMDGVMILFAGAFLITPGLLTDCVGFSLLIPRVRTVFGGWLMRTFKARTSAAFQMSGWTGTSFDTDNSPNDAEQPGVRVLDPETSRDDP